MSQFVKSISEENKAFTALNAEQKKKLKTIFDDIVKDNKFMTLEMSQKFNMYVDEVTEEDAEKDAVDFISSCALCNKERV